ncbi:Uma2 family endonuclease [Argonema antarcticum]|uniref:Uma2 family endonuclease n=1 Tax=Argonema antarcticum TaxID=2942763 RepID=UPI00201220AF|nr:Uma2 family endonuclease [Argonema antarcticum]MCL1469392.1 Uma2 family endonuclease [Argonema antarcticum A004/B2]
MNALTVNFNSIIKLTDEQFFQLCQDNRDLRFERNPNGELIIMPPTGGETGNRNGRLTQQLFNWTATKKKMQEYMDNGIRLGWLIVRASRRVEIYRQGQEVEVLEFPVSLLGEDVLPGFVLNLEPIW